MPKGGPLMNKDRVVVALFLVTLSFQSAILYKQYFGGRSSPPPVADAPPDTVVDPVNANARNQRCQSFRDRIFGL